MKNWHEYYDITKIKTVPRKTLMVALEKFSQEDIIPNKFAIDLGCGAGHDTIELLREGWSVYSIDSQPAAISTLLASVCQLSLLDKVHTQVCPFEKLASLPSSHFINASFSLPFLSPNYFYKFWQILVAALLPGGRFSGSFLGIYDSWNKKSGMTFIQRKKLEDLFVCFNIEFFEEENYSGHDALGNLKHWHTYLVVAKKLNDK